MAMRVAALLCVLTLALAAPARANVPIIASEEEVLGMVAVAGAGLTVGFTILALDENSRGAEMKDDPWPFAGAAVVSALVAVAFGALTVYAVRS